MNKRFLVFVVLCLFIGIAPLHAEYTPDTPDNFYSAALEAVNQSNYEKAYYLFMNASEGYEQENNSDMKRDALRQAKRINWMFLEMQLNRTSADATLETAIPNLTYEERQTILEPGNSIQTTSDGQPYYFEGIARNVLYHNTTLIRESNRKNGESPFFDQVSPYIDEKDLPDNPLYQNHTFVATGIMSIPREELPEKGILKVWLPIPVETTAQHSISVLSVEPEEYVVSEPVTTGTIGETYLEIPLEEMKDGYVNTTIKVIFTSGPRINTVNPDDISPYDENSELFLRYTQSQPNINVSQEIRELAEEIVGNETNPYKKAKLIYDYIIETLPYSNVPHSYLTAMNISESDFVHETGFGDCGTQSTYFAALCRAIGIPARAPGGYQVVPGLDGTHFWAEFYLPEYGWMPVDVTIAEAGDWAYNATPEQIQEYKEFYFGNLDPYRFTIQTDVDERFSGEPDPDILFTAVHQNPVVICSDAEEDVEMLGMFYWSYTFEEIEKDN